MERILRPLSRTLTPLSAAEDYLANNLNPEDPISPNPEGLCEVAKCLLEFTTPPTTSRPLRKASIDSSSSMEVLSPKIHDQLITISSLAQILLSDALIIPPGSPATSTQTIKLQEDERLLLEEVRHIKKIRARSSDFSELPAVTTAAVPPILPIEEAIAAPLALPTEPAAAASQHFIFKKTPVLLVDDETLNLRLGTKLMKNIAKTDDSQSILTADDGVSAIELLNRPFPGGGSLGDHIGIVLIDDQMKRMNGSVAIIEMRKKWPHIMFVIATSNSSFYGTHKEIGFDGFLLKPIKIKEVEVLFKNLYEKFSSDETLAETRLWTRSTK